MTIIPSERSCLLDNIQIFGDDFETLIVDSTDECINKCKEKAECESLTYIPKNKKCYLKSTARGTSENFNEKTVSWVKKCSGETKVFYHDSKTKLKYDMFI